jgi:hypothetical protein
VFQKYLYYGETFKFLVFIITLKYNNKTLTMSLSNSENIEEFLNNFNSTTNFLNNEDDIAIKNLLKLNESNEIMDFTNEPQTTAAVAVNNFVDTTTLEGGGGGVNEEVCMVPQKNKRPKHVKNPEIKEMSNKIKNHFTNISGKYCNAIAKALVLSNDEYLSKLPAEILKKVPEIKSYIFGEPILTTLKIKTTPYNDYINEHYKMYRDLFENKTMISLLLDLQTNSSILYQPFWKDFSFGRETLKKTWIYIKNEKGREPNKNVGDQVESVLVFEFMQEGFILSNYPALENVFREEFNINPEILELLSCNSLNKIIKSKPYMNKTVVGNLFTKEIDMDLILTGHLTLSNLVNILLNPTHCQYGKIYEILESNDFMEKYGNFIKLFIENLKINQGIMTNYSSNVSPKIYQIEELCQFFFMGTFEDIAKFNMLDLSQLPSAWIINYNFNKLFNIFYNPLTLKNKILDYLKTTGIINYKHQSMDTPIKILQIANINKVHFYIHIVTEYFIKIIQFSQMSKQILFKNYTIENNTSTKIKCIKIFNEDQFLCTMLPNGTFINDDLPYSIYEKRNQQCVFVSANDGICVLSDARAIKKRKANDCVESSKKVKKNNPSKIINTLNDIICEVNNDDE